MTNSAELPTVSLEMVAAGEAVFRERCGNMLPESKAECEAAAIAIYGAMERARAESRPSLQGDVVERALSNAWTDFLDANPDDLTSPEDLPDHALMTGKQFAKYARAALDACQPAAELERLQQRVEALEGALRRLGTMTDKYNPVFNFVEARETIRAALGEGP